MRKNIIIFAGGKQGVGKTYRTLQEVAEYIITDKKVNRKGRSVLIFDVNNEKDYAKFEKIPYNPRIENDAERVEWIKKLSYSQTPQIRRISPFFPKRWQCLLSLLH